MFAFAIIILSIMVILVTHFSREHMTNDDLLKTLSKFGSKKEPTKKGIPSAMPIEGPTVAPPEPPKKDDPSGTSGKSGASGSYPDIYGPDIPLMPGKKPTTAKQSSDNTDDDVFSFNPDLQKAFPTEGPPQPFLADFSKIGR
jgi:hypothetical protein